MKSGFGTFAGTLSVSSPSFNRYDDQFAPPAANPGCSTIPGPFYYTAYPVSHLGGTISIETTAANFAGSDGTYLNVFAGLFNPGNACQNIAAADDDGGGGVFLSKIQANFPAGDSIVVVTTFSPN